MNKRNSLVYILSGSQPRIQTLRDIARYGGISPLALLKAAHWITDDDIRAYVGSLDAGDPEIRDHGVEYSPRSDGPAIREILLARGMTSEQIDTAAEVILVVYDLVKLATDQEDETSAQQRPGHVRRTSRTKSPAGESH